MIDCCHGLHRQECKIWISTIDDIKDRENALSRWNVRLLAIRALPSQHPIVRCQHLTSVKTTVAGEAVRRVCLTGHCP